jgi:hypothetical protein
MTRRPLQLVFEPSTFCVDSKDGEDEVKSLDKKIETIIAYEVAMGSRNKGMDDPPRISSRSKKVCRSDACNDADAREEMIELENDQSIL